MIYRKICAEQWSSDECSCGVDNSVENQIRLITKTEGKG